MKTPAPADLQRWSDEIARDPRSLAFLPLARAYRKQGLTEAALQLCLRGLDAYPNHIEGHGLLALLYLEQGDQQRAADEWSMVLRLDADNFDALRGLGFCYFEQDQLSKARQLLERAVLLRPSDPAVQEALGLLGRRQDLSGPPAAAPAVAPAAAPAEGYTDEPWRPESTPGHDRDESARDAAAAPAAAQAAARAPGAAHADEPAAAPPASERAAPPASERAAARAAEPPAAPAVAAAPGAARPDAFAAALPAPAGLAADPATLFDDVLARGPLLGALLIDAHGLVLAGRLTDAIAGEAATLGALLGGAVADAPRTAAYLELGDWAGIMLESETAVLHLAPIRQEALVLLAAGRTVPAGWIRRAAAQAADRARAYLEADV
jgi:predicted regulator of Ras-like GTPase activity (Roadblock/LC7/MglB family)